MAGRLDRFLNLERPRQERDTPAPHAQASAGRFAPEPSAPAPSGLELDSSPPDEQPFVRCARCGQDHDRSAVRCGHCGEDLHSVAQRAFNARLWERQREEAREAEAALARARAPAPLDDAAAVYAHVLEEHAARRAAGLDEARRPGELDESAPLLAGWAAPGMRLLRRLPTARLQLAAALGTALLAATCAVRAWLTFTREGRPSLSYLALIALVALFVPRRPRARW